VVISLSASCITAAANSRLTTSALSADRTSTSGPAPQHVEDQPLGSAVRIVQLVAAVAQRAALLARLPSLGGEPARAPVKRSVSAIASAG
jgi:hypothetical protein